MDKPLRVFSSGMGQQSVAVLVLQALGKIKPFDIHIFCNVGDKAEEPETLKFVKNFALPFAEKHGIRVEVIQKIAKGAPVDLRDAEEMAAKYTFCLFLTVKQGDKLIETALHNSRLM
jgi:hypothetical protein